jgi:hypothetical protein
VAGGLGRGRVAQSTEVYVKQERNWEASFIPGDQEIKARSVASFGGSGSCEAPTIARRKFVWWQQDPLAVASAALVLKQI